MQQKCAVDGCENPVSCKATGLCHKHDLRFKRGGTTELRRKLVDHSQKCIVDGCDRNQQTTMGYCLMHYKRYARTGDVRLTAGRNDYVESYDEHRFEHRRVAEQMLGRKLQPGEVVHHIDFNTRNNDPSNLYVCQNSEHTRIHRLLRGELFRHIPDLIDAGYIVFDGEKYVVG